MKKNFNFKENKHLKRAEVTIDSIMMIALGLLVVLVVFKVFFGGLYKMSSTSKMKSVYEEKTVEEANANNTNYRDPNSQVSVQVMADPDADIEAYHTGAIDAMTSIINSYNGANIGLNITENDKKKLAQQVMLFAMSGSDPNTPLNTVLSELNTVAPDISSFILVSGSYINYTQEKLESTFYGTVYNWYNPNLNNLYKTSDPKNRLKILDDISMKFY